jgi:mono/diheme cytochrome c family protein
VNDASAVNVAQIVLSGERRRTTDSALMMPAFGAAYSDTEIAAVVNYVTARFGAAPSHLTAKDIAESRQSSSQ